jgi:hypothetical protein
MKNSSQEGELMHRKARVDSRFLILNHYHDPMKKILLLFLVSICFSCADDNAKAILIHGEWKLMQAQFINGHESYIGANIIYTFRKDGTLTVAGGKNAGYPDGDHKYTLSPDPDDAQGMFVNINGTKWRFGRTGIVMTLAKTDAGDTNLVFWVK